MNDIRGKINSIFFFITLLIFCGAALAGQNMTFAENHKVSPGTTEEQTGPFVYPIEFYSKYISGADGNRCQMYPSCSQYCIKVFKKHGSLLGWIMCSDRLVRCGRDETKLSAPIWINGEKHTWDPVSSNDFWWEK